MRCRGSSIFTLLTTLLIALPSQAQEDGHFTPLNPISDEVAQTIVDQILDEKVVTPLSRAEEGDLTLQQYWRGNIPQLEATVLSFSVDFALDKARASTPSPAARETPTPRPPFSLYFKNAPDALTIRNSGTSDPALSGGVRFLARANQRRAAFIPGPGDAGVAVFIGKTNLPGMTVALVCPRWPKAPGGRIINKWLEPVPYRATTIHSQVWGRARGQLVSGHLVSEARSIVLTTRDIPPAVLPIDQITQHDPLVESRYRPRQDPTRPYGRLDTFSGIRSILELTTPAGIRRVAYLEDIAWIRPVQLKERFKVLFLKYDFDVFEGNCELVYQQPIRWNLFERIEPLKESDE